MIAPHRLVSALKALRLVVAVEIIFIDAAQAPPLHLFLRRARRMLPHQLAGKSCRAIVLVGGSRRVRNEKIPVFVLPPTDPCAARGFWENNLIGVVHLAPGGGATVEL